MAIGNAIGIPFKRGGAFKFKPAEAPTLLTATVISDTQIDLAWTDNSTHEDGYRIYISTDNITFTVKGTVGENIVVYSATGLTAGTLYYFYIVAYKGTVESVVSNTASATTYHTELVTYITGLITPLSAGQKTLLNTLISCLKSGLSIANLSDAFDTFYVLAGETEESSLKNLVSNAYHCTKNGAPVFVAGQGFTGSLGNYLKTGYKAASHSVRYLQDNCSSGVYVRTNVAENASVAGFLNAAGQGTQVIPRTGLNHYNTSFNSTATGLNDGLSIDSRGIHISTRVLSTEYKNYINKLLKNTPAVASVALVDLEDYILTRNDNGVSGQVTTRQVSMRFLGKGLNLAELSTITDCFEDYMDDYG